MLSLSKSWLRCGLNLRRNVLVRQIVKSKPQKLPSWTEKQEFIFGAFQHFESIYGHCNVDKNYQVFPGDEKWPGVLKPLNLGRLWFNIRCKNQNEVIKPALAELGFSV